MGSHKKEEQITSTKLLEAQSHIWKHTTSILHSMSLKSAIELGIPDIIHSHGKPITLHQLVSSLSIHPSKTPNIHRLMRLLTHSGFFSLQKLHDDPQLEGYVLTEASTLLLKDHPFSVSPFVLSMLDPIITKPMHEMVNWLQKDDDDPTPFDTTYGKSFWNYAWHEPKLHNWFNEILVNDSRLVASLVDDTCKGVFEGLESLVDVGGGTGTMAKAMANKFPKMECIVFDSPYVLNGLKGSQNLKFIEGDMFQAIPPSDGILFKWVLHDWDDEHCLKALKKSKETITSKGKGGKVIIIDMVIENNYENGDHTSIETKLLFDLLMMTVLPGKERSEKEWSNLILSAGFSSYKITPILGLRSLIEVYP